MAEKPSTVQELIDAVRVHLADDGHVLLDRLLAELKVEMWPVQVFEAALDVFGPSVHADRGRTRLMLDRRIRHALTVWRRKYGPFTLEQEAYASSVICSALRAAQRDAGGDRQKLYPFAVTRLDRIVNHEVVHEGFRRRRAGRDRSGEIAGMVTS